MRRDILPARLKSQDTQVRRVIFYNGTRDESIWLDVLGNYTHTQLTPGFSRTTMMTGSLKSGNEVCSAVTTVAATTGEPILVVFGTPATGKNEALS